MVSLDPPERNRDFAEASHANFGLLSDPTKQVARAYGVLSESGDYARRWTFYIDRHGIIRHDDREVSASSHGAEIARRLAALGFPRSE